MGPHALHTTIITNSRLSSALGLQTSALSNLYSYCIRSTTVYSRSFCHGLLLSSHTYSIGQPGVVCTSHLRLVRSDVHRPGPQVTVSRPNPSSPWYYCCLDASVHRHRGRQHHHQRYNDPDSHTALLYYSTYCRQLSITFRTHDRPQKEEVSSVLPQGNEAMCCDEERAATAQQPSPSGTWGQPRARGCGLRWCSIAKARDLLVERGVHGMSTAVDTVQRKNS